MLAKQEHSLRSSTPYTQKLLFKYNMLQKLGSYRVYCSHSCSAHSTGAISQSVSLCFCLSGKTHFFLLADGWITKTEGFIKFTWTSCKHLNTLRLDKATMTLIKVELFFFKSSHWLSSIYKQAHAAWLTFKTGNKRHQKKQHFGTPLWVLLHWIGLSLQHRNTSTRINW